MKINVTSKIYNFKKLYKMEEYGYLNKLPKDLRFKTLVNLPLTELQRLCKIGFPCPDELWKDRAYQKFGEDLDDTYITIPEKYLQIAGFNNEVGYGSKLHIPMEKCILCAIKDNNLELLEYFITIGTSREKNEMIRMDYLSNTSILQTNNLAVIKLLIENNIFQTAIFGKSGSRYL